MKNIVDCSTNFTNEARGFIIKNQTSILSLAIFSVLYVLPLILANTYYIDDMNRTVRGYAWDHDGRFVSSLFMHLLSFHQDIVFSFYPYSIMISSFILSVTGFTITYSLGVRRKYLLFYGSILLATCPFLLEILAYRFDCLPISLSLFCIAVPFLFFDNKKIFFFTSLLSIFVCFGLYQTTALSYWIVFGLFFLKLIWHTKYKAAFISVFIGVIAFVLAFIFYKISLNLLDLTDIMEPQRGEFIFGDENFSNLIEERYNGMRNLVNALLLSSYKYPLYLLVGFNIISLFIYINHRSKAIINQQLFVKLLLTSITIVIMLICTAGINMFVYEPRWVPRAMIGSSVLMYLLFFPLTLNLKWSKSFSFISFAPVLLYSFLISSQFGIYLKNQDEFSDYIIHLASKKMLESDSKLKLVIKGGLPAAYRNSTVNYTTLPIINHLAPVYESNGWYWGNARFNKYDNISSEYISAQERETILKNLKEYPIVDKNIYYILRIQSGIAIIDFEKEE